MHRIRIEVDLDNNEVFQEEIRRAIQDEARRIARDAAHQVVEEEVKRVVAQQVSALSSATYYVAPGSPIDRIRRETTSAIKASLQTEFPKQRLVELAEAHMGKMDAAFEQRVHQIEEAVLNRVDDLFSKALVAKLMGGSQNA